MPWLLVVGGQVQTAGYAFGMRDYGVQCLGCWWSEVRFREAGYASG